MRYAPHGHLQMKTRVLPIVKSYLVLKCLCCFRERSRFHKQHPNLEAASLQWMEDRKTFFDENAKVFKNVSSLYGIAQTFSGNGWLKWRSPPNSDNVAFGWIDREALKGLKRDFCKMSLFKRGEIILTSSAKTAVSHWWSPGKTKDQKSMQFSYHLDYAKRVMRTCYACQCKFGNASLSLGLQMLNK